MAYIHTLSIVEVADGRSGDPLFIVFSKNQNQSGGLTLREEIEDGNLVQVDDGEGRIIIPCICPGKGAYGIRKENAKYTGTFAQKDIQGTPVEPEILDETETYGQYFDLKPGDNTYQNFYTLVVCLISLELPSEHVDGGLMTRPIDEDFISSTIETRMDNFFGYIGPTVDQGIPFFGPGGGIITSDGKKIFLNKNGMAYPVNGDYEQEIVVFRRNGITGKLDPSLQSGTQAQIKRRSDNSIIADCYKGVIYPEVLTEPGDVIYIDGVDSLKLNGKPVTYQQDYTIPSNTGEIIISK